MVDYLLNRNGRYRRCSFLVQLLIDFDTGRSFNDAWAKVIFAIRLFMCVEEDCGLFFKSVFWISFRVEHGQHNYICHEDFE
jgi:hypothetical protein